MEGAEGEQVPKHIRIGFVPDFELSQALFVAGCAYIGHGIVRCQNAMHARAMADWLEMEGIPASDEDDIDRPDLLQVHAPRTSDPFDIMAGI